MTIVAMKHGFTLLPEKIYINANGTINRESMIDQVSNLFGSSLQNIGHQDPSKSKTVEEFIDYAANINAFDFEKKYKRPMSTSERDLAIEAKNVCHSVSNMIHIFRTICMVSEKYLGQESYVI